MKSPYLEGISLCHMCVKAKMSAAGDYYDTNQWHWIRDAAAYHQVCNTIMLRACWRDTAGVFRVDSRFAEDRRRFNNLAALGHYQRVWDGRSPEWQADFYADTTDPLPANEWPMVDIETGVSDPANFLLRWLDRYESRQQRSAAVYAPLALWNALLPVIGNRLKVIPSYSGVPWWGPYDVWQDSQTATFPGGGDAGDRNRTDLTAPFTSLNRDIDAVLAVEAQARQSGPMSVSAPETPSIIDKHAARAIDDVDESPWGEVERGLRHHGQPNRNSWRCWHLGGDRHGWAGCLVRPSGLYVYRPTSWGISVATGSAREETWA